MFYISYTKDTVTAKTLSPDKLFTCIPEREQSKAEESYCISDILVTNGQ